MYSDVTYLSNTVLYGSFLAQDHSVRLAVTSRVCHKTGTVPHCFIREVDFGELALQFGFPDSFLKISFGLCMFWQITHFFATRVTCPSQCMEQGDMW